MQALGAHPEYGMGVRAFPEFLQTLIEGVDDKAEEKKAALGVKLERQVGSR